MYSVYRVLKAQIRDTITRHDHFISVLNKVDHWQMTEAFAVISSIDKRFDDSIEIFFLFVSLVETVHVDNALTCISLT